MDVGDPVLDMVLSYGHPESVDDRHEADGSEFGFGGSAFLGNKSNNDVLEQGRPVPTFLNLLRISARALRRDLGSALSSSTCQRSAPMVLGGFICLRVYLTWLPRILGSLLNIFWIS